MFEARFGGSLSLHEPYMSAEHLEHDIAAGVIFWGYEQDFDVLCGVMGIQQVRDVDLIRRAYVLPTNRDEESEAHSFATWKA